MVLRSTKIEPGCRPWIRPFVPLTASSTAAGVGRLESTMVERLATSAGEAAMVAPSLAVAWASWVMGSKTVTA